MFRQEFTKIYEMTSPANRASIIKKINNSEMVSETVRGQKEEWWTDKHHPDSEVPKNIYALGSGKIDDLHKAYVAKHGAMEYAEFINYTRELIKQKIMI
jgi:hypothetical protein